MRLLVRCSLFLFVAVFSTLPAATSRQDSAGEGEISTDRPDFTEATDLLAPGSVQWEAGVLSSRHHFGASSVHSLGGPFLLLRMGLSERLEMRWSSDGYGVESRLGSTRLNHRSGMSGVSAGLKVRAWEERRIVPALSVITALSLPSGSSAFSSAGREPVVKLCWSKTLPYGFDTGGNVNLQWHGEGSGVERSASWTVGHALPAGFGVYGEIYRIASVEDDERAHWVANSGLTRKIGRQVQVDVEFGHTVHARTPAWFAGAGIAVRLPGVLRPAAQLLTRRGP